MLPGLEGRASEVGRPGSGGGRDDEATSEAAKAFPAASSVKQPVGGERVGERGNT